MMYININQLKDNLPKGWQVKAEKLLGAMKAVRLDNHELYKVIDDNEKLWKLLKNELKKISFGKCWYSEARDIYSHYHVDHFRPKKKAIDSFNPNQLHGGYWWLAFSWTNFRLCGGVGNTKKGNHFAVKSNCATSPEHDCNDEIIYFLDPTNKNDYKKLRVNEDGMIEPSNPNKEQFDYIRANYTIEYLDLNYDSLREARRIKWKKIKLLIDKIDIAEAEFSLQQSATKQTILEEKLEELRKLLAPCEELSSTVRACLRASNRDWALALLEEQIDAKEFCSDYEISIEKEENNVE